MNNLLIYTLAIIMLVHFLPLHTSEAATASPERFNVRNFGAVGNGIADDQPAIIRAVQAVTKNKGGVLYFPYGTYRCARQADVQDAICFIGVSNVSVVFDPGAVLLMDNLNPKNGNGDWGHGILFRGPCSNIRVVNATVKWAKKPSQRSHGDAFRFEGYPSEDRCISDVQILNCSAEYSPQTGAVIMGCSDLYVENFRSKRTGGDGLHFNACRRIHVTGVTGIENGDDTLAFVTYQDDSEELVDGGKHGPYSRADFGEWNNTNSTANNVYAKGGRANGIRLAGAKNISLSNVIVEDKLCAITADCGKKEAGKYGWTYFASRGITITNLTAIRCSTGFFVWNFNQPMTGDDRWWLFDIQLQNMIAKDCTNDSLHVFDAAGVNVQGVKAENCRIRFTHAKDCVLDNVDLTNAPLHVEGQTDADGVRDMPDLRLTIRNSNINNGFVEIRNCRGLVCSNLHISNPTGEGLKTSNVFASRFEGIIVD